MFNISIYEIIIIFLVAILFLKPKDFPVIIEKAKDFIKQLNEIKNDLLEEKHSLEKDIAEIEQNLKLNNKISKEDKKVNE